MEAAEAADPIQRRAERRRAEVIKIKRLGDVG